MFGTRIEDVKLTKVVDGDTVKEELDGKIESLHLSCVDTEESMAGSDKPVTQAVKRAAHWAKAFFGVDEQGLPNRHITIDIEFDTHDPVPHCLRKHRDNYGRLLCYVHKEHANLVIAAVEEGWSPYFVKYGRSNLYHSELLKAEAKAQSKSRAVWNLQTNAEGECRDYGTLIPWWHLCDNVVEDYRRVGLDAGANPCGSTTTISWKQDAPKAR